MIDETATDWINTSSELDRLDVEICFCLYETVYTGDPNNLEQLKDPKYRETLELPRFNRVEKTMARTKEIRGHEEELTKYYKQLIEKAVRNGRDYNMFSQYFWLRLWLWNTESNVHISFPWYDTLAEMQTFFQWLYDRPGSRPFRDIDQGWELVATVINNRIYIYQADPDDDEIQANISLQSDILIKEIKEVEMHAKAIIERLTKEIGADVWTTRGRDPLFGTPDWTPKDALRTKQSFWQRLWKK